MIELGNANLKVITAETVPSNSRTPASRAFFDRILKTKELAFESQGKVEFIFS